MKIFVQAKPYAREEKVEQIDAQNFKVAVTEALIKGQANRAIEKALAGHFKVAPSAVRLVSGFSRKSKVFEIS